MRRIITLITLCFAMQMGMAQSYSSATNKSARKNTTTRTTTKRRLPQLQKKEPSTIRKGNTTLSRYDVARFLNVNHYENDDIVRLMSGYEWVVKGKSEVKREFFPDEISYRIYPSHPDTRLFGHSLFNDQGQLKAVLVLQQSHDKYVYYEDQELGIADILLKCIMAKAYKNNAYQVNLAPEVVRKEIEEQILSGESVLSFDDNVQKATRYCEQLREDCAKKIAEVKRITRVDARTFKVQFADENGNATYSAQVKFRSNGAYKVTYETYLPEGLQAYLLEIRSKANADSGNEYANNAASDSNVYELVELQPQFPGGQGALMSWISSHLMYPSVAQENGISGKVIVEFVVRTDGSVSNAKVVRDIDPSLDKEAVRLVKSMPKWTPGKQGGKPVNVRYTLPVVFRLQ